MPKALITGITGQDGSYLADLLLAKGYEVHGLVRSKDALDQSLIAHLCRDPATYNTRLFLHTADLADATALRTVINKVAPDELYHLAGQTHVGRSFEIPEVTADVIAMGTLRILEIARHLPHPPKFFHASSSEIFGKPPHTPQTLDTPFAPVNPYGVAKAFATQMVQVYRRSYGLFACNGILYNHESPRRGENFVTKRICRGAAAIKLGLERELLLGDTTAQRDWGHAQDYVRGMWMALQHPTPEDFIFATGKLHSVQDVIDIAFATVELDPRAYIKKDPKFLRPAEPQSLLGDPSKAESVLGWKREYQFADIIREMTLGELANPLRVAK